MRQLAGFCRVPLQPGESRRVVFRLPADLLSFTGPDLRRRVEPGPVLLMVGASSRDVRLERRIQLVGETRVVGEGRELFGSARVERDSPDEPA